MPLFGRKILITGGSRGLGRAMALEFTARRAQVAITSRDLERALEAAEEVAAEVAEKRPDAGEPTVVGLACDVNDLDSVKAAVAGTCQQLGGLTDVVANVGQGGQFGRFDHRDPKEWRQTFCTNLFGTYHTFLACIQPILDSGGGSLIGVSGYGAIRAVPFVSAYSTSKAAVVSLTRTLALALGPDIRVNAVAPGWMEGDWMMRMLGDNYDRLMERRARMTPLKRCVTADDVADSMMSLVERNRFVTGEIVVVDGGFAAST